MPTPTTARRWARHYQLLDDFLGVFGDPAVTGNPNLDDLREGKPTVLFAATLERSAEHDQRRLLAVYGNSRLDEESAKELRCLMR
ncbi:polyprenyl synthetase family protein [Streptomyces sp. NPDC048659]|uniref:polyprenyl synthetase family protein n=1 Tax=Streptomyces sp. NPDC048659 TaxID=3155489 RepID=UPI00341862DF